ncbi:hypothetical protein AKN87_02085 [Thiopseudomonas alkaliphila]|uniref:hypothetical protein n=1 Tax=Thiopseudomonas alkaliphila TaxID=1697053 RepID=UPI00069EB8C4|nr:hypothetical protein [Thiopseudomonas alkaliphila]AKX44025.1 hypothetical protein AKN87_02085 [Thiopseudomonas alkaliphila]AKX46262.1 hypothetical protein AKN94_01950 [Thiopseudomonas alkaliphila]AKX49332.1 hypothetical protein AKN93_07930 [Thiopseudomonas alkaliphila]AKX52759.1 hypothetical protein AKN91_03035 [Thiopseudomonas alkaliphila]AKX54323.1 hypothetical protein AKN90_00225 [Thiopseudomonas alkaliphila]
MKIYFPAAAERLGYLFLSCFLLHGCLVEADSTPAKTHVESQLTHHLPTLAEQLSTTTTLQPQTEFTLPEAELVHAEAEETFVF